MPKPTYMQSFVGLPHEGKQKSLEHEKGFFTLLQYTRTRGASQKIECAADSAVYVHWPGLLSCLLCHLAARSLGTAGGSARSPSPAAPPLPAAPSAVLGPWDATVESSAGACLSLGTPAVLAGVGVAAVTAVAFPLCALARDGKNIVESKPTNEYRRRC